MRPVYLDNAATTPLDPRVIERMLTMLGPDGCFGNPASRTHRHGQAAHAAIEVARAQVAALLGVEPREIVFTSGATEANNLALKGIAARHPGAHLVTSAIEHAAVLDTCTWLERNGHPVTRVAAQPDGQISCAAIAGALRADTCLVSVMHANNETGVINDIAAIARLCRERGIVFHVDAAQGAGHVPLALDRIPADLVSLSAHKMHGPKGCGALFVRRRAGVEPQAQMHGGGQEGGLRAGTLASHQVVGFGEACAIAAHEMHDEGARIAALRDRLERAVLALGGVRVNGRGARLPGHLNLAFEGIDGELLLQALAADLSVSAGSACTSASREPSHVLRAMGLAPDLARASLRFSLGRFNRAEDVDVAIDAVSRALRALRG